MKQIAPALFVVVLLLAACGGRQHRTVTEELRESLDPKVGAFIVEAQRAYNRGAYAMALDFTDSAEVYAPELADLHYIRAMVYTAKNSLDIAHYAYQRVIELDPEYRGAWYGLGLNAFRRGEMRDAISFYEQELEINESSPVYHELGRVYAKLSVADSAETAYLKAVELDTTNTTAMMWLSQLYEEMGEFEKALEWSRRGAAQQPDNLNYRYIVGSQLQRMGESAEALEVLVPVAEKMPWHHGAQFNTAQALMALGRADDAQPYFTQADSAQQHQQRVNDANNEINAKPEVLEHWLHLADLLRKSGEYERAIASYKVAVSLDPWNMYLQSNLAMMMAESGDYESAIRRYRAIVSIDSTLADVWTNLGVAYAELGRRDLARRAFEVALRQRPGDPTVRRFIRDIDTKSDSAAPTSP